LRMAAVANGPVRALIDEQRPFRRP
jgi:hypothetical protein